MSKLTMPNWVEERSYQRLAIRNWVEAGGKGILRMATGTGKTITALSAATRVSEHINSGLLIVVTVPYQHLVNQWTAELREFGANPVKGFESRRNWQPNLERKILELNGGHLETCVLVTTHRTLSMDSTQQTLKRAVGQPMLIADEVHHLGANQSQNALMEKFTFRLGLSATPKRWYDEEGTEVLESYFGGTVFEYGLSEAIESSALCEYYYVPHIVELQPDEMEEYMQLTSKIGRLSARQSDDGEFTLEGNQALQQALFRRARLIGTARQKLDLLVGLINQQDELNHSLVYCSDGAMGVNGEGARHIDATTGLLRKKCSLDVSQFTAREDQSEREELLEKFESGKIAVLTAIRCLDEGVDVPSTKTAYILASTSNPRQYIQRRGRILRPHKNKDYAVIHDFITVPDTTRHPQVLSDDRYEVERKLIRKELHRVSTFADAARNHPDADIDGVPTTDQSLHEIKQRYNLLTV